MVLKNASFSLKVSRCNSDRIHFQWIQLFLNVHFFVLLIRNSCTSFHEVLGWVSCLHRLCGDWIPCARTFLKCFGPKLGLQPESLWWGIKTKKDKPMWFHTRPYVALLKLCAKPWNHTYLAGPFCWWLGQKRWRSSRQGKYFVIIKMQSSNRVALSSYFINF